MDEKRTDVDSNDVSDSGSDVECIGGESCTCPFCESAWPQWFQVLLVFLIVICIITVFEYLGIGNAQHKWDRPMTPPESLYQPRIR